MVDRIPRRQRYRRALCVHRVGKTALTMQRGAQRLPYPGLRRTGIDQLACQRLGLRVLALLDQANQPLEVLRFNLLRMGFCVLWHGCHRHGKKLRTGRSNNGGKHTMRGHRDGVKRGALLTLAQMRAANLKQRT